MLDSEDVEGFSQCVVNNILDRLGSVIKSRDRGHYDGAHFRDTHHISEVTEVEWRFAHQEKQAASFFERYIGGAGQQIIGVRMCQGGKGFYAARGNDHSIMPERAARKLCGDVIDQIGVGCELPDLVCLELRFKLNCLFAGSGDHQVSFDIRQF